MFDALGVWHRYTSNIRPLVFAGAHLSWLLAAIVQLAVRPFGLDLVQNPFLVFDWAPSFLFAFGVLLFALGKRSASPIANALAAGVGASCYEILQIALPWGTFDWGDLVASAAAIPLALTIFGLVTVSERG